MIDLCTNKKDGCKIHFLKSPASLVFFVSITRLHTALGFLFIIHWAIKKKLINSTYVPLQYLGLYELVWALASPNIRWSTNHFISYHPYISQIMSRVDHLPDEMSSLGEILRCGITHACCVAKRFTISLISKAMWIVYI